MSNFWTIDFQKDTWAIVYNFSKEEIDTRMRKQVSKDRYVKISIQIDLKLTFNNLAQYGYFWYAMSFTHAY